MAADVGDASLGSEFRRDCRWPIWRFVVPVHLLHSSRVFSSSSLFLSFLRRPVTRGRGHDVDDEDGERSQSRGPLENDEVPKESFPLSCSFASLLARLVVPHLAFSRAGAASASATESFIEKSLDRRSADTHPALSSRFASVQPELLSQAPDRQRVIQEEPKKRTKNELEERNEEVSPRASEQ